MIKVNDERDQINIAKIYEAEQEHIFQWWDELNPEGRRRILDQISDLDLQLLSQLVKQHLGPNAKKARKKQLAPPPILQLPSRESETGSQQRQELQKLGEEAIAAGKVAVMMSAGEDATTLGYRCPLGMLEIAPISNKSLYQWHGEKIMAMNKYYRTSMPWVIMLSQATKAQTIEHFEKHSFFGLSSADIQFIDQKMLPLVDKRGKMVLASKDSIYLSTNGYGGILQAMRDGAVLEALEQQGVEILFYSPIENPLLKIADPLFLGYHIQEEAEVSTKVVRKQSVDERADVVSYIDGNLGVLGHDDLPEEEKHALRQDGNLTFYAANTGIHAFSLPFLKRLLDENIELPYHKTEAKLDPEDDPEIPKKNPPLFRFETFAFDILQAAEKKIFVEVPREEEYLPLRSKTGPNSLEAVRKKLSDLFCFWFSQLGEEYLANPSNVVLEVSPNFAFSFEVFQEKVGKEGIC